MANNWVNFRL